MTATSFQVYNNTQTNERTDQAVDETYGQLLTFESENPLTPFTIPPPAVMGRMEAYGGNYRRESSLSQIHAD